MKEQEIKETLSDIRNMMERSQKVIYIDGASGILAGIWALIGAIAISQIIYGSIRPILGAWMDPVHRMDWATVGIVAAICIAVFGASFLTVWRMSKSRAARKGMEFTLDAGARRLLKSFFTIMIVGGLVCLTPIVNGLFNMIPGVMLVFYGLALVVISPIALRISVTKYIGYVEIFLGIAALAIASWGMMFWTIGFCVVHLIWGIWFHFVFDRKDR